LHHTVEDWVAKGDRGELPVPREITERPKLIDPFLSKIEEWVERSKGKIRADVVFDRLVAVGFDGSSRTVRRAVARVKANYKRGRRRVYRPWIPEPGMWAQWDWGRGPTIGGRPTNLFCAWFGWSRFRVVIATWDRTMPTLIGCLDRARPGAGGAPTYWLTDNERTVRVDHVAGIAVRNPAIVAAGHRYGVTIETCVPFDPESKGGVEATVKIAKADLVPTDTKPRADYRNWAELVDACEAFMAEVNGRPHRATGRAPVEMLADERRHMHRLTDVGYTACFGQTRRVSWSATVGFGGVTYAVPHTLADETVWVRVEGDELVAVHLAGRGATEVARHALSTPGHPMIDDSHYPPRPAGPLGREPKATNTAEAAFLQLGDGARTWLIEAGASGASRVKAKMADAVELSALHGPNRVDWALGHAATFGRFDDGDTASILAAHPIGDTHRAGEDHSLQDGTSAWEGFGQ
jgi:transposase